MKNTFRAILISMLTLFHFHIYTLELHRSLSSLEHEAHCFVWEETKVKPFDELIISWNAKRPAEGSYLIQVSLLIPEKSSEWSPWFDYAFWGAHDQYTFHKKTADSYMQVYQDAVEVLEGNMATGFRVRVLEKEAASLEGFRTLHVSITDRPVHSIQITTIENDFLLLDVEGLSQIALPDERRQRLCSPTSTAAVVHFLSGNKSLSPLSFADHVVDSAFDIYGNWVLNTAQASHVLGDDWHCFVARLVSFDQVIDQLRKGYPVVVSVKGPLAGGAFPYESGHLLVVTGFDSKNQAVICMDPAFPTDSSTLVKYPLSEFLAAWSRRQGVAYVFDHSN